MRTTRNPAARTRGIGTPGGRAAARRHTTEEDGGMLQMTDEVTCEPGVTRLFGDGDLGRHGLLSGWAAPEEGHVWNDGPEAVLRLRTGRPRAPCTLTFEGEPFLGQGCARQDLVLYLNGFRIGFWRLTEPRTYRLAATIEPEQLFERDGAAVARCIWHLPHSVRPAVLGQGTDTRELGFCFRTLTITENGQG